jgi:MtfA peptidase
VALPDIWRPIVDRYCPPWRSLDGDARLRLEQVTLDLIADKRWESVRNLELTDEMIVAVAAQAALPVREIGIEHYRRIRSILIAPGAMRAAGIRTGPAGTRMSGRTTVVGEAHHDGLVRLSWATVRQDALFPARGRNVVIHEFAHQLDLLDGWIDGTPPLPGIDGEHWVEVCTRRMDEVRRGEGPGVLRAYAGTGPGEFFAVASEAFFTIPERMAADLADLYELLATYYRQDPMHQKGSDPF